MFIYRLELKKLLSSAAVWGFLAVCLLFNLFIIGQSVDEYADDVGAASEQTGVVLDPSFYEKLSQMTASGDRASQHLERLKAETDGVTDVFDGYETRNIGERYIAAAGTTGYFAEAMRDKYAALQKVVDEKAKNDESLTLYFAGATYSRHQFLFNTLLGWLLTEAALVAVLLALLSVGYEHMFRTGHIVYSTKKGREVLRPKLAASLSAGLGAYALLALLTLLVYFGVNEYGDVWRSNVSSLFNYRVDLIAGNRPFVTWYSFSVLTYLLAMLAAGAGVVLCFSLLAFGMGIWIRNSYIAFLVFLAAHAVCIAVPVQMPSTWPMGPAVKYSAALSPVWLWLKHGLWFTDGDIDILWAHFETIGLFVSLVVLAAFCLFSALCFRKRNLA
jgi:hypothetical protein